MRHDLDRLMTERELDAFIIPGNEGHNAYRDYITGGVKASALVIKKRDADPILIVNHMETDEAKKSGLPVMTHDDFDLMAIIQEHGRGTEASAAAFWGRVFDKLDLRGKLTFYGSADMQYALRVVGLMGGKLSARVKVVSDKTPNIFETAFETKDPDEVEKLRESGVRASAAMRQVREWLSSHRADGDVVHPHVRDDVRIGNR